jgi:hypothetical protein
MPDGVLHTSGTPLVGHDAIRSWGRARAASTVQTRHICSGMRFTDRGNGRATGSTLLTVFMHDGDARGPPGAGPTATTRNRADGRRSVMAGSAWDCQERHPVLPA